MRYVADSYAWVEYLKGSEPGERVKEIIEDEGKSIFTSVLTIAEVISMLTRENADCEIAYEYILSISRCVAIDEGFAKDAGRIHAQLRKKIKDFGLVDAFVLLLAKKLKAKILTGDEHFRNFKETVMIN